jgi:hypothetical protein
MVSQIGDGGTPKHESRLIINRSEFVRERQRMEEEAEEIQMMQDQSGLLNNVKTTKIMNATTESRLVDVN